jgi:FkbM family methyltransferase
MLKHLLKNILLKVFPLSIQNVITEPYKKEIHNLKLRPECYAQEGEDLILTEYFDNIKEGFFVDVGAYNPVLFSNTYLFYLKGWRGINIDARPGSMEQFNIVRPRDINVETAVGVEEKTLTYYMFDEPALNGFSKQISEDRNSNTPFQIVNTVDLQLKRLETILNEHLPAGQEISFMSVDVEGLDLEVLNSNNWDKYKPKMMLVETSVTADGIAFESPIHLFLESKGYYFVAKTYRTSFYKIK